MKKAKLNPDNVRNILIIGSIGIGNLLLFSPALRLLKKQYSTAKITMIVLKKGFKPLYDHDDRVDSVIALDHKKLTTYVKIIPIIIWLFCKRFEICITTFPSKQPQYSILAYILHAKHRISHRYNSKIEQKIPFLQNLRVSLDESAHDVEQNLNLLKPLEIECNDFQKKLYLDTGEEAKKNAGNYFRDNGLDGKLVVGIHPGSSIERGMILKRWPTEKFAEICDWLMEKYNAVPLIFGGPEEKTLCTKIVNHAKSNPHIVSGVDLLTAAEIIGKCSCFLTNDSGLMHVAVSMDVPIISLFGPTDQGRTSPFGQAHSVIRQELECSPCWSIKNLGVGNVNCIHPENICMTQLDTNLVKREISDLINGLNDV